MLISELPKVAEVRVSQCEKAKLPILDTLLGITIASSAVQRAKADLLMAVIELPKSILFSDEQPIKAASPMEHVALSMATVTNLPHS